MKSEKDIAISRITFFLSDRISNAIAWSRYPGKSKEKARIDSHTTLEQIEALLREELRKLPDNPL